MLKHRVHRGIAGRRIISDGTEAASPNAAPAKATSSTVYDFVRSKSLQLVISGTFCDTTTLAKAE
jgi:hypothetical protein